MQPFRLRPITLLVCAVCLTFGCAGGEKREAGSAPAPSSGVVIRITGSDTMVNLVQAWAENYKKKRSDISVQVGGGGSGVGIAGLIHGILDLAGSSREMGP